MIADIYDALTMVRPYKKAWTIDDSDKFIKEGSGTFFAPNLVELFLTLLDGFIEIRKYYKD